MRIKTLHFVQKDYRIHSAGGSLLLKTVIGDDFSNQKWTLFSYGSDFSRESLHTHLEILLTNYDGDFHFYFLL